MATALRIEPFLLENESLLGSCGTGNGLVCITDLRLMRVERTLLGRRIRDLSYREVSSVVVADELRLRELVVGVLLILLGFALPRLIPQVVAVLDASRSLRLTIESSQAIAALGAVLVLVGLGAAIAAAIRRRPYVALEGPFLLRDRRQRANWRFSTPTPSDARIFATLVRQRLTEAAQSDRKKVLPFDT